MLLAPPIPLLFMGEEWAASSPFLFFCNFEPDLARAVTDGRRLEFGHFAEFADPAARERIPDPASPTTFERSRLDWDERDREPHATWLRFYRDLLAIRAREIVPRVAGVRGTDAGFTRAGDGGLDAWWSLANGETLRLHANLADTPRPSAGRENDGRTLYAGSAADVCAAWSVRWSLT